MKKYGSLGESSCNCKKYGVYGWQRCWKRGSFEPYIRVTSRMGLPPPRGQNKNNWKSPSCLCCLLWRGPHHSSNRPSTCCHIKDSILQQLLSGLPERKSSFQGHASFSQTYTNQNYFGIIKTKTMLAFHSSRPIPIKKQSVIIKTMQLYFCPFVQWLFIIFIFRKTFSLFV